MTITDLRSSLVIKLTRLPVGATVEEIEGWLEENGVDTETVRLCGHGRSAFAELRNVDDATKARRIRKPLREQRPSVYRSSKTEMENILSPPDNCVHLSELPFNVIKADILDFFSPLALGENGIFLCLDRKGRQQGEGYVQFIDEEAAKKSIEKDGQILLSRAVTVQRTNLKLMKLAQEKSFKHLFYRYVGKDVNGVVEEQFSEDGAIVKLIGLPVNVTEEKIKQWFKEDDVVTQAIFLPDDQKKKGALKNARAFVQLETLDDLKKALQKDRRFMDIDILMYNVPAWKVKQTLITLKLEDDMVHVKKLPSVYKETDIKALFKGSHIAPNGIYLYRMPWKKDMMGAYVQFNDVSSAVRALRKNNAVIGERRIIVERSSLKKREIGESKAAKRKLKDSMETKEKPVPEKKKKQNKKKSRNMQSNTEASSEQQDTKIEKDDVKCEEISSKKYSVKDKHVSKKSEKHGLQTPVERLQPDNRQRHGSLKRKSILRDCNLESQKSVSSSPSKKTVLSVLSPKKKRRSSMRFAATPKMI